MSRKVFALFVSLALILSIVACVKKPVFEIFIDYKINAEFIEQEKEINASMTVDFKNITDKELINLNFNLYPNIYRENSKTAPVSSLYYSQAYANGESYGAIDIIDCTDGGKNLNFEIIGTDQNILSITLEKSLFPKERAQVKIDFKVRLANINHRLGYNDKTINLGHWYPSLCINTNSGWLENDYSSWGKPIASDCANYEVSFKTQNSYTVAATGEVVGLSSEGIYTSYTYKAQKVRDFALVLSKDFNVATIKFQDTDIYYYYLNDDDFENTLNTIKKSLEFYSASFEQYPYSVYSVVQTPFSHFGEEFSSLIMLNDTLSAQDLIETSVLKTANQWWYNLVGANLGDCAYLNNGLAQLSKDMFFDKHSDYGFKSLDSVDKALDLYRSYYDNFSQLEKKVDTSMQRALKDFNNEFEYINLTQNKSLIMLSYARQALGNKNFDQALKKFCQSFKYQNAQGEDFIGFFEKTRLNTTQYFYSFIDGDVII